MFMMGNGMQRIYELLALVVALYFPAALLTWLVIDKFLTAADGKGHSVSRRHIRENQGHVLAERKSREA